MASKEKLKKHGRNIYFKESDLWNRLQSVAIEKNWSLNQVVELTMAEKYPREK
jgi:hypothetical protein